MSFTVHKNGKGVFNMDCNYTTIVYSIISIFVGTVVKLLQNEPFHHTVYEWCSWLAEGFALLVHILLLHLTNFLGNGIMGLICKTMWFRGLGLSVNLLIWVIYMHSCQVSIWGIVAHVLCIFCFLLASQEEVLSYNLWWNLLWRMKGFSGPCTALKFFWNLLFIICFAEGACLSVDQIVGHGEGQCHFGLKISWFTHWRGLRGGHWSSSQEVSIALYWCLCHQYTLPSEYPWTYTSLYTRCFSPQMQWSVLCISGQVACNHIIVYLLCQTIGM